MATAKQLAARKRFAEMARSGAFKKAAKKTMPKPARKSTRKSNPAIPQSIATRSAKNQYSMPYVVQADYGYSKWSNVAAFSHLSMAEKFAKTIAKNGGASLMAVRVVNILL